MNHNILPRYLEHILRAEDPQVEELRQQLAQVRSEFARYQQTHPPVSAAPESTDRWDNALSQYLAILKKAITQAHDRGDWPVETMREYQATEWVLHQWREYQQKMGQVMILHDELERQRLVAMIAPALPMTAVLDALAEDKPEWLLG